MNDNEKYIIKSTLEISKALNLNLKQEQDLKEVLYKCSRNYDMNEVIYEKSSFMDMLNLYLEAKKIEGLSERTLKNRFYALRELDNFLQKGYKDVNVSDLRMYISHKQNDICPTSINNIIAHIKPFFNWLSDEEYIKYNPSQKLKRTKEPKRLINALTTIELEKIRLACTNDRDRALIEFAFATGMRVSEIKDVNRDDLCSSNNKLRTIGKGDKERYVLFSDKAKFYIDKYLNTRTDNNKALFVAKRKPYGRLGTRQIEKIFSKIKKAAGVESKVTPHTLRRTMATKMIEGGADITTVQYLLGHDNLETTLLYAKTSNDKVDFQYKQVLNG